MASKSQSSFCFQQSFLSLFLLLFFFFPFVVDSSNSSEGFKRDTIPHSQRSHYLIQLGPNEDPVWMTKAEVQQLIALRGEEEEGEGEREEKREREGKREEKREREREREREGKRRKGRFMDLTYHQSHTRFPMMNKKKTKPPIPTNPTQQPLVRSLIPLLSQTQLRSTIEHLSSYPTRYYDSSTGVDAALWIHNQFASFANNVSSNFELLFYNHSNWAQPSVIARYRGNGARSNEVVIIAAHEDSINSQNHQARAPGADDDASGVSLVLEVFRVLSAASFVPKRTIEFHSYSAEELGLLGSQDIAANYSEEGIEVAAMMMLDQSAFLNPQKELIGVLTDYTDSDLSNLLRKLIQTYSDLPYGDTKCGYACTDMASWYKYGYATCHEAESLLPYTSPNSHTTRDTIDKLSLSHAIQLTRVALGYMIELSLVD